MSELVVQLSSEDEQVAFGEALAQVLRPSMVIFLEGELGAGKTTLARGIARGLGHEGAVKSPTYTLVEPYQALRIPLYHFDLYRLGDPQELEYLGVRDYFDEGSLVLVEWPSRGVGYLPAPDLTVQLAVVPPGRRLTLSASTSRGADCLAAVDARRWAAPEVHGSICD